MFHFFVLLIVTYMKCAYLTYVLAAISCIAAVLSQASEHIRLDTFPNELMIEPIYYYVLYVTTLL